MNVRVCVCEAFNVPPPQYLKVGFFLFLLLLFIRWQQFRIQITINITERNALTSCYLQIGSILMLLISNSVTSISHLSQPFGVCVCVCVLARCFQIYMKQKNEKIPQKEDQHSLVCVCVYACICDSRSCCWII